MEKVSELEVWQRGPIEGVPSLLQPVAHALLQVAEDIEKEMNTFPHDLLWERPAGLASVGFHLKHLKGVVDRLFTYAEQKALTDEQMSYLKGESVADDLTSARMLVDRFREQVATAIGQLKRTDPDGLTDHRGIGRKQIPSSVIGLLFHAAEHTQRHVGQLIVTARTLKARA